MRRLAIGLVFAAMLAATPAVAQTGSVKTQSQLNTEIGTTGCTFPTCLYPDNNSGQIAPINLRQGLLDLTATLFNGVPLPSIAGFSVMGNPTAGFAVPGAIQATNADQVLVVNHAASSIVWGQVNLQGGVTGVLPAANGGTGITGQAYITSGVPYTSAVNILAPGWKNVTSITLLANTNYEVWASLGFEHDTAQQSINSNISQIGAAMTIGTGNVVQPFDAGLINTFAGNGLFNQAQTSALPVGPMRFTCGATTCTCAASGPQDCGSGTGLVINLNGYCGGTGPCVGFGRLQARQIP
jgi:hypothetical protein